MLPEQMWWWKVALHLDEAQGALTTALVFNDDDPTPVHALHDKFVKAQVLLLEIFRLKGFLPDLAKTPDAAQRVAASAEVVADVEVAAAEVVAEVEAAAANEAAVDVGVVAVEVGVEAAPVIQEAEATAIAPTPSGHEHMKPRMRSRDKSGHEA